MTDMKTGNYKDSTIAAQAGVDADEAHGAVMPPLYLSSNFSFDGYGGKRAYDYTRSGNPTRDLLGNALAQLERGAGGVVTASGMAAVDLPFALLAPGDLLLAPHDCYGGTYRLLRARERKGHFRLAFINQSDEAALRAAFAQKPRMILVETPSNPLLRLTDIALAAKLAKECGALCVADNTFLSPALQKPLTLGADIVVHSTTKYLNGHGDVVGGAVIAADPEIHKELAWWANCLGTTGAPYDSYMTLRGLRTLEMRITRQQDTAAAIAAFLNAHPAVERVNYPGLPDHPGHGLAARQQKGFGAMLSFELKGGESAVRSLLEKLSLFTLAESLGGVESLIAHPASMTHAAMDPQARHEAGIADTLLRISAGVEDKTDLLAALDAALS